MRTAARMLYRVLAAITAVAPGAVFADEVSFDRDVLPILNSRCVMCHVPGAELGGLSLYPDAWLSIVGVASTQSPLKLIEPGAPDRSYLYLKLLGTQNTAEVRGLPMPTTQVLDTTAIEAIRRWIDQGAKRN